MPTREITTAHLKLVRGIAARVYRRVSPGRAVDIDDLESVGNITMVEVFQKYLDVPEDHFNKILRAAVAKRMIDEIRRLTHKGKDRIMKPMPVDSETGESLAVVDRGAASPLATLAANEELDNVLAKYIHLPTPAEAAAKAASLRAAVLDAISVVDVKLIIEAQVDKAKGGDSSAARFVLGLINQQE